MKSTLGVAVVALALVAAAPAPAHHSAAMFDNTRTETVAATVKEFQWTNPHGWLYLTVTDADGKPAEFSIELTSPNLLMRRGWRPSTFRVGDKVTAVFNPFRDGTRGGKVVSITKADGSVFTER